MSMANDDHEFIEWCSVVRSEGANCKSYSTAPVCVPSLDGCVGEVHSTAPV